VAPPRLDETLAQLEDEFPGRSHATLQALLLRPPRVYELKATEPKRRVTALVTVEADEGVTRLVRGDLEAETTGNELQACSAVSLNVAGLTSDAYRVLLSDVAAHLTPDSLAARDPDGPPLTAVVIGRSSKAARSQLRRGLWAYGIRVELFLDQPERRAHETVRQVQSFQGEFSVLLLKGCEGMAGKLIGLTQSKSKPVLLLQQEEPELLMIEVEDRLAEMSIDVLVPPEGAAERQGWAGAADRIRDLASQHPGFVLTKRCSKGLENCPYRDHARLEEHLERLARLADKWVEAGGSIGARFDNWALREVGLDIALHDAELVNKNLDQFDFEGQRYSRVPHVKVDDAKAFTDCARIYFAIDHASRRLIIDHVGLHLY